MSLFLEPLVIERATAGSDDEYGQPTQTWATLATVPGRIAPKSGATFREVALLNRGGAVIGDYTIYLPMTDVTAADRIRREADTVYYELTGVRDPAGQGHHLEIDARRIG